MSTITITVKGKAKTGKSIIIARIQRMLREAKFQGEVKLTGMDDEQEFHKQKEHWSMMKLPLEGIEIINIKERHS